ncbi:MAG: hypothetical protein KKG99_15115 [Bacteroidetes bacterium]|nr:hypothetical protein [Bacteroidota bacterium]
MIKKAFFLIILLTGIDSIVNAQEKIYAQRDIEIYQKEATQLVNYFEYTLNLIGNPSTLAKEKDIIINQSYLKIFKNEFVQIEDDLDEYRTVPTNKNVQAYLKDIDFFFTNAEIIFTIQDVGYFLTEDNQLYFKFQINRNLIGKLINGDSINTNKIRFIEINVDDAHKDLKIASVYTTKLNEEEELRNWWNSIPMNWKTILGEDHLINDFIFLHQIISFTDSTYVFNADSIRKFKIDTLLVRGKDTLSKPRFDSIPITYLKTVKFNPETLYKQLRNIVSLSEINIANNQQIENLNALDKLSNLRRLDISNTRINDLSPIRNLTKLESLICEGTQIESLVHLRYLSNLRVLNLNNTPVHDLKPLQSIDKLEQLYLNYTKIDSLDPLFQLKHLMDLRFSNTAISDLKPLNQIVTLEVLHFNSTAVNSVEPLTNLDNLRILVMDNTRIDQLDPLKNLKNLKQIFCDNAMISPAAANQFMKTNPQVLVVFQSAELKAWWESLNAIWKGIFRKYHYLDEKPTNAQLQELIKLKIIDISKRPEILNLGPLKKFIYLEHLNCSHTSISDLDPISDLVDIKYLDFSNSNIVSIIPLMNLSKLESLYFYNTSVNDLTPLNSLNFLQQINFEHTQVKNLTPLTDLTNLKIVYADSSKVEIEDYLNFNPTNEDVLVVFQTNYLMNWWETLANSWKEVFTKKINLTEGFTKETLHQIASIKSLDISNNIRLKTLEPLKNLHVLKELIFSGTQMSDLGPLENLRRLTRIECGNNPISNLGPIMNLPKLSYLDISNIPIRDFEQVQFMTSLETLICPGTQIKSLKYLEYLISLKILECYNTNIKNLTAIENLNLELLKCYNTGLNQKRVLKFKESHPNTEVVFY